MPSPLMSSSSSSTSPGTRLFELLEEQQEPFLLGAYLLENGCPSRSMKCENPATCWPGSACMRKLHRLACNGFRRQREGILRSTFEALVQVRNRRKALGLTRSVTNSSESNQLSYTGGTDLEEISFAKRTEWECMENSKQLSPVSVFELQYEDSDSPTHVHFQEGDSSGSSFKLRTVGADILQETSGEAIMQWRPSEWSFSAEEVERITQLIHSDFSYSTKEWSQQLQCQIKEVGDEIGEEIFDWIIEHVVLDILCLPCTL